MTRIRPAGVSACVALLAVAGLVSLGAQPASRGEPFRVAFTSGMLAGLNTNDAKAAMNVWAETIARSRGLQLDTSTDIVDDIDELRKAVDAGAVHLVALSLEQYRRLGRPQFGTILLGGREGQYRDEFLLLVQHGRFTSLASLKGRSLVTIEGLGYDMSMSWLTGKLVDAGLAPSARHFGSLSTVTKTARAILPVFFGQQDACVASRQAYEVMVELNPQLGTALTALATSPPVVHSVVIFDRRYAPARREAVLEALLALHETPRGQQVLNLFGLDRLKVGTAHDLASSLGLLARVGEAQGTGK